MNDEIQTYWKQFCEKKGLPCETPFDAWSFGEGKAMADELAALVLCGRKRATCSAYELYEEGETMSRPGEYNMILDGEGHPVCVTQTTEVSILPFNRVTPEQAAAEGEGDLSYEYWHRVHTDFFDRAYRACGKRFYESAPVVYERFERADRADEGSEATREEQSESEAATNAASG